MDGIQLGCAPRRTILIGDGQLDNAEPLVECVQGHVRLKLKAFDEDRVIFDKLAAEGPVAAHYIRKAGVKERVDEKEHKMIAEIVKKSLVFYFVAPVGKPVANHHVRFAGQYRSKQLPRLRCGIGQVSIRKQIIVCVDFLERLSNCISLTLLFFSKYTPLSTYLIQCFSCNFCRIITGIIIHYPELCLGNLGMK